MSKTWTTVVKPKTGLFDIPVKEILKYKNLVYTLVKRNYQVQYKQTILGPLWMIFGLIFSSGIFSFVFGYVGNFSSDGTPYFLFYMTGSIVWSFFEDNFHSNTGVLMENSYLFGKVYFPRLIMPISNYVFNLVKVGIKFLVLMCVWGFFLFRGETVFTGLPILLMIIVVLIAGVMGTAGGLIIACMTIKYRDFKHLTGLLMTLLMYCSPVLYSLNQLPDWLRRIVFINPVSSLVEISRYALCGSGVIHWGAFVYTLVVTVVVSVIALVYFNQTERSYIDII